MRYIVMAIAMVLACHDLSAAQAANPYERESLRGLPGVYVIIEAIASDAQTDGLTQEVIRTSVELILRSNGIRVLTESESLATIASPYLYVRVGTVKNGLLYGLDVIIQLSQQVSLVHKPKVRMFAATWETSQIGTVGKDKLRDIPSTAIEPLVKAFANDFLAVNPR
jgi:hypothetical protein